LALVATLISLQNAAAEHVEELDLNVLIQDQVGVPADTLEKARQEASRIFEELRVRLVWVDRVVPRTRNLIIKIAPKPPRGAGRNPDILGVAVETKQASGTVAWLFYDRIEALRELFNLDAGLFLGHVLAHEMGHLLLPSGSHVMAGIMKAGWDANQARLASAGDLTFGPRQAATIRAYLAGVKTAPRP